MIDLTLATIAEIVHGNLVLDNLAEVQPTPTPQTLVNGPVETDSREVVAGGIFVAKPGEFTDGHLFAAAAVDNGAALIIGERPLAVPIPQIVVADSVEALGMLATAVVARVRALGSLAIIGITGSNGKTTTKNLLRTILEHVGSTIAPRASFNNEVGAPLTMLQLTKDTQFLVAEMGASKQGEITRLVHMAKPDIGIVLTVGLAHAGEFGGIESTLTAKTEMVTDLTADDTAILNADDPRVVSMRTKTSAQILWFGLAEHADVRATNIVSSATGTTFVLHMPGTESRNVSFRVLGEHHVMNALASAAAAHVLKVPIDDIVDALESVSLAERWRMQVLGGGRNITVINDAYNASPDSMAAALKTLAQITSPAARTVAVLGAMSELGELSGEEHDRIGLQAVRLNIDQLIVVGSEARRIHITAINEGSWNGESLYVETPDEAYDLLKHTAQDGDVILVKSSNSAQLRFLGDRLGELFS
jgi:UDP-N-acetylmuramoyl-tripeptide--D-alanyl-D-alanine ligase